MESQPLLHYKVRGSQPTTASSAQPRTAFYGLAWITLSAMIVAIPTVAVRFAVTRYGFPASAAVLLRCVVQLVFSSFSLIFIIKVSPFDLTPFHRAILLLRGLCGSISLVLLYTGIKFLPAGVVASISAFSPILAMLLSRVFLKETSSVWDVICAFVGIAGVSLIAGPSASSQDVIGVLLVFLAACFSAAAYVCVRGMGTDVHFMLSVFALGAVGVPVAAMHGGSLALHHIVHNRVSVIIVLFGSVGGFIAHCCLNKGLQLCKAGEGTIMKNVQVPTAYVLGMLILNEEPSFQRIIGSMLVVSAVVTVGLRRLMKS